MRISDWSSDVCSSDLSAIRASSSAMRIFGKGLPFGRVPPSRGGEPLRSRDVPAEACRRSPGRRRRPPCAPDRKLRNAGKAAYTPGGEGKRFWSLSDVQERLSLRDRKGVVLGKSVFVS